MNGSLKIGSLFRIPILIHWTFLLVIPLFAWIIGVQIGLTTELIASLYKVTIDTSVIASGYMPYILGTVVAIGLFIGVLIHEIAHSLVALKNGIRINSITLLFFGGISSMEEGTPDPKVELPLALVGPLASLAIGLVCIPLVYGAGFLITDPGMEGVFVFTIGYLGLLNILLFAFNLIPAFPMDGGRVLRAFLAQRMPLPRATQIAANVGKIFAVIFGIIGLVFLNFILIIIALFIYLGASQESTAVKYSFLLKDVTVGDIMSRDLMSVLPTMPVRDMISHMYSSKHLGFPVIENGVLIGMVTLNDVHRVPPLDRDAMQVRDIMTRNVISLPPGAPVIDALRIMSGQDIGRIPVVDEGRVAGIVTRNDILKVIELREA
ncbi:MAG: CBS domain-containing protein [Methanoregulaceae archaeon]|nr:CBS domain-containing protein [Methanoregulaceae archaeon]